MTPPLLFSIIETTGFSPIKNRIIEIGAVKIKNGEIIDRFSEFINSSGTYSLQDRETHQHYR
ncbi:exonuclease domain-containing protein [Butyrivibrio sp. FCS014]|uniref:exonuclease domain-containing protein n=1 Tax=Butyrivibrio sp. FCS014 TaxID=1408304 RepID=UPI0004B3970C